LPNGVAAAAPAVQVNPLTYTHSRGGKVLTMRTVEDAETKRSGDKETLPVPASPCLPVFPTAARQLAGLGGSTDHEISAAASGQVAGCCSPPLKTES